MLSSKIKLISLFGFRGTGKSTLATSLVANYPNTFYRVTQVTTRSRRPKENPNEYVWLTEEEYHRCENSLFAKTTVSHNLYGTLISHINKEDPNKIGIVIVDDQGAQDFTPLNEEEFFVLKTGLRTTNPAVIERNQDQDKYASNLKTYDLMDLVIATKENEFITPSEYIHTINQYCESKYHEQFISVF